MPGLSPAGRVPAGQHDSSHCFLFQLAGLERGCGQGPARGQHGGGRALRCLQSSFQKLSVELALEKLEEMKAHVRRMQSSRGLAAWNEARQRYQDSRRILEEMLAELQEAWGAQADGQGHAAGAAAPCEEAPGCRAATSPEPVVSGSRGAAEQPEAGAGEPGQPRPGSVPSPTLGKEPSSPQQQGLEGDQECHRHVPAATSLPKPERRDSLVAAGHVSPERGQPPHRQPLSLPPRAHVPGTDPLCSPAVPHGTVPAPSTHRSPADTWAGATQYFQVSSQSSFSSEDSDLQNSTEEAPAASVALPRDLPSPRPPCPSENPPQIVYLENHHTKSPAKANAKSNQSVPAGAVPAQLWKP